MEGQTLQKPTRILSGAIRRGGAWCALVLLAALLAGCGAATAQHAGTTATATWQIPTTAPVTPTATVAPPIKGAALNWSHTTLPSDFGMLFHWSDMKFAGSDGATAYACGGQAATNQPQMLVTHDGGHTWGTLRTLTGVSECDEITVDSINPSIAIVHGAFSQNIAASLLTTNGGSTWTPTPNTASLSIQALATVSGRAYAIIAHSNSSGQVMQDVEQSNDGLHSWQPIDGDIAQAEHPQVGGNYLSNLWVNPATGALLVSVQLNGGFDLWQSNDDGQHWTQLKPPSPDTAFGRFVVQQPFAAQPWHICYLANLSLIAVMCSSDGGATWVSEPQFWQYTQNTDFISIIGLPGDGSLLLTARNEFYRLPAHSTQWQDIGGTSPASGGTYFAPDAGGSGGTLWQTPIESDGAGMADPPNMIYTAIYPY